MDASHCRLRTTGNSCAHAFPIATRTEHRGAALSRLMADIRDSDDPRSDLDVRTFALDAADWRSVCETVRDADVRARA